MTQTQAIDGFWLPAALRPLLADAAWETVWLKAGALSQEPADDAVAVRWPKFTLAQWRALLAGLQQGRSAGGRDVVLRWQAAFEAAVPRLMQQAETLLPLLATCTGYSIEMLAASLQQSELVNTRPLTATLALQPTWSVATRWERMAGLPGWLRFFPAGRAWRLLAGLRGSAPLCRPAPAVDLALGYAAGNVPGTALLIMLLASAANSARNEPAPAVLVRSSRHEPLFTPWVLSAIEEADPTLAAGLAVLVWDYQEADVQATLMRAAGLLLAAAGDDTIAALDRDRARYAPALRFHRHGHKASFAVIEDPSPRNTLLAALDSALWDQNGCLSARVHFVAGDADAYGRLLAAQMRELAGRLPRGATPRRPVHRAFDAYKALEAGGQVTVHSAYEDDFAVVSDRRPWDADGLRRAVNACQGRVIVARPARDVLDVPALLRAIPAGNLQSVSVAMNPDRVLEFATRAGAAGVTAVRSLGRAAFPQLAYSWDGLLPLDAGCLRPAGHFTTVEFDDLEQELAASAARWAP